MKTGCTLLLITAALIPSQAITASPSIAYGITMQTCTCLCTGTKPGGDATIYYDPSGTDVYFETVPDSTQTAVQQQAACKANNTKLCKGWTEIAPGPDNIPAFGQWTGTQNNCDIYNGAKPTPAPTPAIIMTPLLPAKNGPAITNPLTPSMP